MTDTTIEIDALIERLIYCHPERTQRVRDEAVEALRTLTGQLEQLQLNFVELEREYLSTNAELQSQLEQAEKALIPDEFWDFARGGCACWIEVDGHTGFEIGFTCGLGRFETTDVYSIEDIPNTIRKLIASSTPPEQVSE